MATSAKLPKSRRPRTGKAGHPQEYDRAALTKAICARLATGEPMAVICRELKVPVRTVNDWRKADEAIATRFDEARELGFDAIAHECLVIANTPQLGIVEKMEPMKMRNGHLKLVVTERRQEDMLGHRKLQIETRLKLLAKWDPKRYGDKVQLANHEGGELPAPQFIVQPVRPAGSSE